MNIRFLAKIHMIESAKNHKIHKCKKNNFKFMIQMNKFLNKYHNLWDKNPKKNLLMLRIVKKPTEVMVLKIPTLFQICWKEREMLNKINLIVIVNISIDLAVRIIMVFLVWLKGRLVLRKTCLLEIILLIKIMKKRECLIVIRIMIKNLDWWV